MKEAISYGLGFVFDREKAIIAIPMPRFHKDNNRRLHNENGAAVIWNDGYEQYYLWGVKFDEKLYNQIIQKKLSAKEILKLENMEQRMTALKILGTEKLLEELNAKLLDKSGLGNELYLVENVFNQPAFFLKYSCPSTGRIYVSGVDPLIKNNPKADFAMSWKYGLTLDDYLGITNQT